MTKYLNQQRISREPISNQAGTPPKPRVMRNVLDFTGTGMGLWEIPISMLTQRATTRKFIIADTKDSRNTLRDPKARFQCYAIDMVL